MERVVERSNMQMAYKRVKRNKGAPGVDGMSVDQLGLFLRAHWPKIKKRLYEGTYEPKPVRRVQIPKSNGGVRTLGIPTVLDRLIQQALHQVLSPLFEPGFSESSYGFRPGRSAHQAVLKAREFQRAGKRWVVDMDLAQFFDEVNHEMLMKQGLSEERAARSAFNQRGPWFNAGSSHMNQAFPKRYFDQFGLISTLKTLHRLGTVLT
ncbi:MAG: hypothetical protein JRI76_11885 [Deltaproteobacteria bacterium]|nr:hypothetical protein [Deltaproteobacteria bacterium]